MGVGSPKHYDARFKMLRVLWSETCQPVLHANCDSKSGVSKTAAYLRTMLMFIFIFMPWPLDLPDMEMF